MLVQLFKKLQYLRELKLWCGGFKRFEVEKYMAADKADIGPSINLWNLLSIWMEAEWMWPMYS